MSQDNPLTMLERDGIVVLPNLFTPQMLADMQAAFERALQFHSWNTWSGYEQNEKFRRLVENLLTLDPGYLRLALHSTVIDVLDAYLGEHYCLTEARGWETVATLRSFHGWHNDAWYDTTIAQVPREVKLGVYLTNVETGYFRYVRGSHRKQHPPMHWSEKQVAEMQAIGEEIVDVKGPAGTTFLFDTSGVHRQSSPVLKPRWGLFYNYHDPRIPIQALDVGYGRYAPLLLNAAFLEELTPKVQRILGCGDRSSWNQQQAASRQRLYPWLHSTIISALKVYLEMQDWIGQFRRVQQGIRRRLPRFTTRKSQ